jgi:lysophospholipase L1-like esterase
MKKLFIAICILFVTIPCFSFANEGTWRAAMNGLDPQDGGIVMVGDSITAMGQWSQVLGMKVRNAGMSGWTSSKVLTAIDSLVTGNPDYIFICIGTNDIGLMYRSTTSIIGTYTNILNRLYQIAPNSVVVIQAVTPTRKGTQPAINKLNIALEQLAISRGITFLDVATPLMDSTGKLATQYSYDGLHLKGQAYEVWGDIIKEFLCN